MRKRMIAMLLALAALFTLGGCKRAEETEAQTASQPLTTGRYVESEIALPLPEGVANQMVLGVAAEADGGSSVVTVAYGSEAESYRCRYFRHTLFADGTSETAEERWLNELAPFGGNELHTLAAKDGALYMIYSDYDEDGNSRAHILVSRDGGASGTELTGDGVQSMGMITSFGVLDGGEIAVANFYDGTLLLLDGDGNRVETLASDNKGRVNVAAANGGFVAYAVPDGKVVRVYNAADQTTAEYAYTFSEQSTPQLAVAADGAVLLADNTGIYRHAPGGTIWEKLVDGATSTFGLPSFYGSLLYAAAEDGYPALLLSDGGQLLSYRYDAATAAAADKALTVFSLHGNDTVRQAIVAFNRVRGNVKVTYSVAMEGATGGTEQDYIKALNTELLAGTGPDILLLDGLPIDSYIEKDVLADLTDAAAGAEPALSNLTACFTRDGGLYAVPTGFLLPVAIAAPGYENAFGSLSALADAAERAGETPLLSPCAFSYRTLALCLHQYYGGALQTGDAGAVEAFLTDAKRISDAIGCTDRLGEGWTALKELSQDELYETFSDYFGSPQIFAVASGLAQSILMQPVGSVAQCMEPVAVAEQNGSSIVSVGGRYVPVGIVGVNKASAEPEAAGAFVRMLLSYGAQGGNQYAEQFPVNQQALQEMLAYHNDGVSSGMMLNDGTDFTALWPKQASRDRLGALIESLDTPMVADTALRQMLLPEIEACLSGANTAEQAAERIGSLLATYLSE